MNSNFGIEVQAVAKRMPCPCCGAQIALGVAACNCGARFVGRPFDETPAKIRRFGPAATSALLLVLAIGLTAIATKWLAPLALVPAWFALRALRLEKSDPDGYGGRRVAAATLTLAILGSAGMATYGISYIPRAIENYRIRRAAATEAKMHHIAAILEEYKAANNGYPDDIAAYKKLLNGEVPADYWEKAIRYQSYLEPLARNDGLRTPGKPPIQYSTFELRSAGPDGIEGTDDDIIMRDGVFYTSAEIKKLPAVRTSSDR
ncbi:MAG: type II secretion system protein GspG [Blastocatellia bacterium]